MFIKISFFILLISTIITFIYKTGKKAKETEIIKNNNKLRKKYNEKKLIILMIFLTSCKTVSISTACPEIQFYTLEEQQEVDKIRKEINNLILNKFLIDYGNLRNSLKITEY